ncbi:hypothetical protein BaRGS_00023741 [Batillaria attramentaria]|uniref:Uncharacterized protein n=1 Tax=Batillaria attramentaria TaxID=370345 RepID=A0ABD0KCV5_9CAEN
MFPLVQCINSQHVFTNTQKHQCVDEHLTLHTQNVTVARRYSYGLRTGNLHKTSTRRGRRLERSALLSPGALTQHDPKLANPPSAGWQTRSYRRVSTALKTVRCFECAGLCEC